MKKISFTLSEKFHLLFFLLMISTHIATAEVEELQIRVHGDASLPTLVYLPGLQGDWTLVGSFRAAVAGKVRFVEFTYPRTLDWSLEKYAEEIEKALLQNGITHGWLLGESFGSQIVWPLATRAQNGNSTFRADGIILAGGFVKHPNALGVRFAKSFSGSLPQPCFKLGLSFYAKYAKFRHHRAPETLAHIDEFVARRTEPDRQAMKHRLRLIAANDPRPLAKKISVPVFALAGFWDPIVPRFLTQRWLKRNCPAYRNWKTIYNADHNVLGTAPQKSADIILPWMRPTGS